MITPYVDGLLLFFRRLKWLERRIPVVAAGPDHAHGQMLEYMARRQAATEGKKLDVVRKTLTYSKITRPFGSVLVTMGGYDPNRFSTFVHRGIAIDEEKGTALSVQEARPENLTIQFDLWCGDDWHMANNIIGQLKNLFPSDDVKVPIFFGDEKFYQPPYQVPKHCKYMGDITCRLTDEGVTDSSDYTGSRDLPKEIRKTFSGTLFAWLPRVPYEVKLVKELTYTLEDDTGYPPIVMETNTINFVVV